MVAVIGQEMLSLKLLEDEQNVENKGKRNKKCLRIAQPNDKDLF